MNKKVALITGGSKGIGLGVAEQLIKDDYHVAITGRDHSALKEAHKYLLDKTGENVLIIEADARDYNAQESSVSKVLDAYGRLDVLVANAGVGHFESIDKLTVDQWNDTIDINLTGVFYSVKASVEALKKSEGYIITIASLAGTNFFEKGGAYNASKFGLVGFTQAIMLDLRPFGIKVSTIMPGSVATHFNGHVPNDGDFWKIQPEDIGIMVSDLLKMNPRTLPSKIEVRPSFPSQKKK